MKLRRIAWLVAVVAVMWFAALLAALGAIQGHRIAGQVTERIGESLMATAVVAQLGTSGARARGRAWSSTT